MSNIQQGQMTTPFVYCWWN